MKEALDAYLDGEIADEASIVAVEEHLDAETRERLGAARALGARLRGLPRASAPASLRAQVEACLRSGRPRLGRRALLGWGLGAAVLTLGGGLWVLLPREDLAPALVADHVKMLQSEASGSLATDDVARLERWLATSLDFWPVLPRWSWARPVSGRLCHLGGSKIARVHYRCGETDLSLFVAPGAPGGEGPRSARVQEHRGYRLLAWEQSGLRYYLVVPSSDTAVLEHLRAEG